VAPVVVHDFEAIAPIRAIEGIPDDVPVLILTGSEDRLARPTEAMALRDRANKLASVELIQGAGHNSVLEADPELYQRLVLRFCKDVGHAWDE
jgi:uncharacterized protein